MTENLTLTVSRNSFLENAGAQAAQGTVTRDGDTASALVVTLTSSDLSELTVPTTVTIAAGKESSDPFVITAINDNTQDGTQAVTITAQANLYQDTSVSMNVKDDESDPTYNWHNENLPEDVNYDGVVSPLDALHVINELNQHGSYELPESRPDNRPYVDVNKDGWLSPADAIQVINVLNQDGHSLSFELTLSNADGDPISSVAQNEEFYINLFAEDLTPTGSGVFAAYVDMYLPESHLEIIGNPLFENSFVNGKSGDLNTEGLVDEWGAFAGISKTGSGKLVVSRIPVRAIKPGAVLVLLDPADTSPLHDVLLYDRETALAVSEIDFQSLEFMINESAEGEYEARVDEVLAETWASE